MIMKTKIILFTTLLWLSIQGEIIGEVDGEITPVSVSMTKEVDSRYVASKATDRNTETQAYSPGNDSWLKARLDKQYCVEEVRHWIHHALQTHTCSRDACTCSGSYCSAWPVSVYSEDGTDPDNAPSDCMIGDTVKFDGSVIKYTWVSELVIIGREVIVASDSDCSTPIIEKGTVTPDSEISSGASYNVACDSGFVISGQNTITCTNSELSISPKCLPAPDCSTPIIEKGTVTPDSKISSGASYNVACDSGFVISGSTTVTCINGELSVSPTCVPVIVAPDSDCSTPIIEKGTVTPDSEISSGASYNVACDSGFVISGQNTITCTNSELSKSPKCLPAPDCSTPIIEKGTVTPDSKISSGASYNVACDSGFVISGSTTVNCMNGKLSVSPTCVPGEIIGEVDGEITPVSVSMTKEVDSRYVASKATDRKTETQAYSPGNDSWLKARLDKQYCVEEVRHWIYSTLQTHTCSRDVCTCSGSYCSAWPVSVYSEDGTDPDNAPSDCMIGDTVKFDGSVVKYTWVSELVIIGREVIVASDSDCSTPIIEKGTLTPDSEISSGASYNVACDSGFVISGQNTITCTNSELSISPKCLPAPDCSTPIIEKGTVTPDSKISSGASYNVACDSGFVISGSTTVTCMNGELSASPTCVPEVIVAPDSDCSTPIIEKGTVTPDSEISSGASYNVACDSGFVISGQNTITCTNSELSISPKCLPAPDCSTPIIEKGTVTPDSKISSGASYNVACDSGFVISGSTTVTCINGELSVSPTCVPELCKSADLAIENGVMTVHNGATTPYEQGEKVSYKCNDRFKLVGNSELTCNNRAWSYAAPLCKPVNAKCPSYEVNNGKVMDESSGPFLTTESVSAICDYGYNLNGTNPRVCEDAGWKTDAQNCVYKEGRCPPLKHLVHGGLSCNGGDIKNSCTVSCDPGYIYLSEIKKVTCQEDLRWSHQSFTNSQGNFAACAKQETPKSRVLEAELYLDVNYCKTDPEKAAVVAAFETYIHSGSAAVPCVTGAKCTVQNTSCKNSDGSSVVSFELLQNGDLSSENASTLTSSDSRLKELVSTEAMTFEVTTSKKRATTRFTAEDGSYTGNVKTACEAGFAQISGSCITCPAGYHIPGVYICNACAVGTYSTAPNSVGCEKCTGGSTTYGEGSTSSGDCKELCKVPGVTHGSMSPPTGYNVDPNTLIKMTCDNGSVLHTGEEKFKCSTGIVPTCKEDGDKVSDGGGSTTVIIVVVVVVLVVLAAVVIAAFFIRKRYLYSSDQNHAVRKTDNRAPVSETAETQNI
ncbi:sushi, von Willebrand factor type A, EGF and pentraxin domain-containing protein 1-like isoform X2 [Bolinopsis microptera]|uniref:sushi, von Willebrand factor type A, EGF and pentraxin domain-containing protein 1-like isoform X2 n=1 Tax=Bolinopsis microptera TaxID=2820187 RepID=UPI003078DB1B